MNINLAIYGVLFWWLVLIETMITLQPPKFKYVEFKTTKTENIEFANNFLSNEKLFKMLKGLK